MTVRAFDHINIATDRLEETRDFFVNVVGLVEGRRPSAGNRPGYWLYAGDRAVVHLGSRTGPMASTENNVVDHFALELSEFDGVADKLRAMGIPFVEFGMPSGPLRQIIVTDPNGVKVELNHRGAS